jgi:hypothetical protein
VEKALFYLTGNTAGKKAGMEKAVRLLTRAGCDRKRYSDVLYIRGHFFISKIGGGAGQGLRMGLKARGGRGAWTMKEGKSGKND